MQEVQEFAHLCGIAEPLRIFEGNAVTEVVTGHRFTIVDAGDSPGLE